MTTTDDAIIEVSAEKIIEVIATVTNLPVIVEHTGGGVATLYVGVPNEDDRYHAVIGPGWFRGGSFARGAVFDFRDLYAGPDDDGASDATPVTSLVEVRDVVEGLLR